MPPPPNNSPSPTSIDLKDPLLAAFLAWLVPGLGHFYQGRNGKGILFCVCILGTFLFGLYLGSSPEVGYGRSVYVSLRKGERSYAYLGQVGTGLVAMPAMVQAHRIHSGKVPLWGEFMTPPANGNVRSDIRKKLGGYLELATTFTLVAGMLNVLAIYDAWGGPVFAEAIEPETSQEGETP